MPERPQKISPFEITGVEFVDTPRLREFVANLEMQRIGLTQLLAPLDAVQVLIAAQ